MKLGGKTMTEVIKSKVSLVLQLEDSFSGERPFGKIDVSINYEAPRVVQNLSGHFVFLDLEEGEYRVRVKSRYYFTAFVPVNLSELDPRQPLIKVSLIPGPDYPFPAGTTLIRGRVKDNDENWVTGASVYVVGKEFQAKTDRRGEFVLYFKNLTEEDITILPTEKDKHYIKGAGPAQTRLFVRADKIDSSGNVVISGRVVVNKLREGTMFSIDPPIQMLSV